MKDEQNCTIKYFGCGTNRDPEMMEHMIGRKNIKGESGKLFGFDLCIQKATQFRDEIPENSPADISPRDIILQVWGPDFEMYVSRPNPDAIISGTIWHITPDELELIREWELVDYGAQEEAKGIAINSKGETVEVITQSFLKSQPEIDRVVDSDNYEPYIASKKDMLRKADEVRFEYLDLKKKNNK